MKILLLDNYDSFTYNLKSLLAANGAEVKVLRNDKIEKAELENAEALVFSPGPGIPSEAGQMMEIIQEYYLSKPILGICLGMQAIGEIFGASLELLDRPIHGFGATVKHSGDHIFASLPFEFTAARYHSWVLESSTVLAPLQVIAQTEDNKVMAVKHQEFPVYGFQFHPESILTESGNQLIQNFMTEAKKYTYAKVTR
jgi:anthranilate synthase component 2